MTAISKGLEAYIDVEFINNENALFQINQHNNVSITYKEKTYDHVGFYRSFPLTNEGIFISIKDDEDKEIGLIKDLSDMENKELVQVIQKKLEVRYFCPVIESILKLKEEYGYCYFTTETSAGTRDFILNRHDRPIKRMHDDRYQIMDMDGNRYFMKAFEHYEDKHIKIIENLL